MLAENEKRAVFARAKRGFCDYEVVSMWEWLAAPNIMMEIMYLGLRHSLEDESSLNAILYFHFLHNLASSCNKDYFKGLQTLCITLRLHCKNLHLNKSCSLTSQKNNLVFLERLEQKKICH